MDSITNVTLLSWAVHLIECTVLWYFKALKHIFSKLPLCISSVVHSLSHWLQARFQVWYHAYIYMHSMYFVSCVQRRWKYIDCSWYSHVCGFVVCCFRVFFPFFFQKGAVMCKPECLRSPHFLEIVIDLFVSRILQNIAKNCPFALQISHCFLSCTYVIGKTRLILWECCIMCILFFFFPLSRLTTENIQAEKGKMLVSSHTDDRTC